MPSRHQHLVDVASAATAAVSSSSTVHDVNANYALPLKTSFAGPGCAATRDDCPIASFEKAMEINMRGGPKCHVGHTEECCNAIQKARDAARR